MDNYLFYRWPEDRGGGEKPPRRRRRVARNLLVCLALVAALGGILIGGWFLTAAALDRWASTLPEPSDQWTAPVESLPAGEGAVLTVPRAETGLGVTLDLAEDGGTQLSAQAVYQAVLPSVVSVVTEKAATMEYGAGSGIIMREDGYILTNYHVIEGGSRVTVMLLSDSSTHEAELVGYDEEYDVAVLKIDAAGLSAASFGDSDALKVGDPAYAIGNPMGYLYGSMSDGIISAVTRGIKVGGYDMTLIQTTAALNSGNSGGALVNGAGQVVGITVAKISGQSDGVMPEGLGLAIPIADVRPFINRILETGESWRPTMGITCYAVEADGTTGILVKTVEAGTPAEQAGLTGEDLIVAVNGRRTESVYALKRALNETGVGGTIRCSILRDGAAMELSFALFDRMDGE